MFIAWKIVVIAPSIHAQVRTSPFLIVIGVIQLGTILSDTLLSSCVTFEKIE